MNPQHNSFEKLIDSFKVTCSALEKRAEFNLKKVEKECEEELLASLKALKNFNGLVSGISETCSEVVNNNEIFKSATKISSTDNVLNIPYPMHSDFVKCIHELYNMQPLGKNVEGKLINENEELLTDLVKICEKNSNDIKDFESAITEAKEIF